jgi:PHD/YefM family antitoxin component YafN of YafNO toxin-antitoxin module
MRKVNALQLRQSLSKIIALLKKDGEPILLEKGRQPAAVIISLADFRERFVEKNAEAERKKIYAEIQGMARPSIDRTSAEDILRGLRDT